MSRDLLADKEVAMLPGSCSVHTLRAARARAHRNGYHYDVPQHVRIGNGRGRVRYRAADVAQWLAKRGVATEGAL
jgi:predicted DNA-binding transcriptional regulator AlpA